MAVPGHEAAIAALLDKWKTLPYEKKRTPYAQFCYVYTGMCASVASRLFLSGMQRTMD